MQKLYLNQTPPPTKVVLLSEKEQKDWVKDVQGLTEQYVSSSPPSPPPGERRPGDLVFCFLSYCKRKGIVINDTMLMVHVQLLTGRRYLPCPDGRVQLEKQWAKQVLPFPYQTVVKVMLGPSSGGGKGSGWEWSPLSSPEMASASLVLAGHNGL